MRIIIYIIALTLAQVLLFNHIVFFDSVMPQMYVFVAVMLYRNMPRWASMLTCFATGLCMDMFNNTPGLAAFSMTLAGFVQPYILSAFLHKEDAPNLSPSVKTMGIVKFSAYAMFVAGVFFLSFYTLEAFSFYHIAEWFIGCLGSLIITLLLIITFDSLRK